MKTGIELITEERQRQISQEGWSPEHDDRHSLGELNAAAMCYAHEAQLATYGHALGDCPDEWPFDEAWWKPSKDQIRNLTKAGAMIAAELDRLQRLNTN